MTASDFLVEFIPLQKAKLSQVTERSSFSVIVVVKLISRVQLFATPWTVIHQGPLSIGFSRQEYWSAVPLPSPQHHSWKASILRYSAQGIENQNEKRLHLPC